MQANENDNGEPGLEDIALGFLQGAANLTLNKSAASAGVSVADVSHGSTAAATLPTWATPTVLIGGVIAAIVVVVVAKKFID